MTASTAGRRSRHPHSNQRAPSLARARVGSDGHVGSGKTGTDTHPDSTDKDRPRKQEVLAPVATRRCNPALIILDKFMVFRRADRDLARRRSTVNLPTGSASRCTRSTLTRSPARPKPDPYQEQFAGLLRYEFKDADNSRPTFETFMEYRSIQSSIPRRPSAMRSHPKLPSSPSRSPESRRASRSSGTEWRARSRGKMVYGDVT
jgi:hypothetical protein